MAHTACINRHSMWNGDGKPCVWIYEVKFFVEFMKSHPGFLLCHPEGDDEFGMQIYDCFDEMGVEEPDGWYCDECGCLAVFLGDRRVDYEPIADISIQFAEIADWEDYVACRDDEFERFQDFYENKSPVDALEQFSFKIRYKLSTDGKYAYGYNDKKEIVNGFVRVRDI